MPGVCRPLRKDGKWIQNSSENPKGREHLKDLVVQWRVILIRILK